MMKMTASFIFLFYASLWTLSIAGYASGQGSISAHIWMDPKPWAWEWENVCDGTNMNSDGKCEEGISWHGPNWAAGKYNCYDVNWPMRGFKCECNQCQRHVCDFAETGYVKSACEKVSAGIDERVDDMS